MCWNAPVATATLDGQIPEGRARYRSSSSTIARRPRRQCPDLAYVFQAEIEVRARLRLFRGRTCVVRRPPTGTNRSQICTTPTRPSTQLATASRPTGNVDGRQCRLLRTAWIPSAEVEKTDDRARTGRRAVDGGARGARRWCRRRAGAATARDAAIAHGSRHSGGPSALSKEARRETADELLRLAVLRPIGSSAGSRFSRRMPTRSTPSAWRIAPWHGPSRSVLESRRRAGGRSSSPSSCSTSPGLADPRARRPRRSVDLLFFPTGGGKTEAYLGLAAFAIVLRRLRQPGDAGCGAGVSVIMRYTLRLLTLDQLARAAALVCALELEREQDAASATATGRSRSASGSAWPRRPTARQQGRRATDTARAKVAAFKSDRKGKPSPIPLENCPWCGDATSGRDSFTLLPNDDAPQRPADRLRELRAATSRATGPARSGGRRADLSPPAGLPDRDRRQVRRAAVGRPGRRASSAV